MPTAILTVEDQIYVPCARKPVRRRERPLWRRAVGRAPRSGRARSAARLRGPVWDPGGWLGSGTGDGRDEIPWTIRAFCAHADISSGARDPRERAWGPSASMAQRVGGRLPNSEVSVRDSEPNEHSIAGQCQTVNLSMRASTKLQYVMLPKPCTQPGVVAIFDVRAAPRCQSTSRSLNGCASIIDRMNCRR